MQVKKFSVERLGFRGFFILALCFLFLVPATAQELLDYPLDTVNGEEVYKYRVERSIGLYRIGVNFDVSQAEIIRLNPQLKERGVRYDEELLIPTKRPVVKQQAERPIKEPIDPRLERWEKRLARDTMMEVDPVVVTVPEDTVTVIEEDTIAVVDSIVDTREIVELALLLPFESQQTKRSGNAERMLEFYQGALLALRDLQNDSTLYRLRGFSSNPNSVTMDTDGEDLGPEVAPAAASKYYGSAVPSLRMRFRIGLGLLAILAWISLGLPVSGMLRTVKVAAGMCLALQLVIMLLSLDVITTAAVNMARLRFGADSLAALTCVLTSFDALAVALDAFGTPHMPLCLLSSLSLLGVLYSSLLAARGLRKALRVPSIAKRCYSVTGESELKGKGITLLKTDRPIVGFVRRTEEAGPDETAFLRAAPALLILSLIFAVVIAAARHAGGDFLYILTALLSPAVPVTALLCFSLPYFLGSNRIFYSGAAVAGWSGLSDVGRSQNLIITDRDLFPEGSVEVDTVRIFADAEPEKILSYAGTMILASGSGIAPCFAELMNRNGGTMRHVDNFEFLPGGGMKGVIDGSTVLCGGTELMRLMNVRIPYRLVDKTTVLLAVDGVLYGIFNMKYLPQPQVRKALIGLIRSSRHPVFAVRDFNVNPEMLRELFEVATDGYDFPPYMERFKLSEAPADSEAPIAAVICREGLGPLSLMADTGRSMYLATRLNLIVTLIAAVAGVFTVFIRFLTVGQVGVPFLFAFLVLWALPVAAASLFLKF